MKLNIFIPKRVLLTTMAIFSIISITISSHSHAGLIINIQELGSDVVGTVNGSLDLSGLTDNATIANFLGVRGANGFIGSGTNSVSLQAYSGISGPENWGTGSLVEATSAMGDVFAFNANFGDSPRFSYL